MSAKICGLARDKHSTALGQRSAMSVTKKRKAKTARRRSRRRSYHRPKKPKAESVSPQISTLAFVVCNACRSGMIELGSASPNCLHLRAKDFRMIMYRRNAANSIHIGKFRLWKSAEKNCSEAGSYYSDPASIRVSMRARMSSFPVFLREEMRKTLPTPTPMAFAISARRFVSCARESLSHLVAMTVKGML